MYQNMIGNQTVIHGKRKAISPRDENSDDSVNDNKSNEKIPKWKQERENFIKAVRLGKQINKLEKDPNLNNDPEL